MVNEHAWYNPQEDIYRLFWNHNNKIYMHVAAETKLQIHTTQQQILKKIVIVVVQD